MLFLSQNVSGGPVENNTIYIVSCLITYDVYSIMCATTGCATIVKDFRMNTIKCLSINSILIHIIKTNIEMCLEES